jgi:hypothetical protein
MRDFEIELGQLINEMVSETNIHQIIEALDMYVLLLEERRAPAGPAHNEAGGIWEPD